MSDIAIRVDGLGKQYRIGSVRESYKTLRDTITDAFTSPFRRASSLLRGQAYGAAGLDETIWALRNVSFEVKRGEVVGVIGRNGAGKSTLLKVLSRITEPTTGRAEIHGRIGSLLEVGTGFHPELTGRENIYLNGAILGMQRQEIENKFDEMVAFAEVEKFIDTPVKHYSSGMYLRLAFAVAAHLDPEILLVDEVLAVGDVKFQQKCLGKMNEVAEEGRTVLFVSHNMAAARQLCQTGLVLDRGQAIYRGDISTAIEFYTQEYTPEETTALINTREHRNRSGIGGGRIVGVGLFDANGSPETTFGIGEPLRMRLEIELERAVPNLVAGVEVRAINGTQLVNLRSDSVSTVFDLDDDERQISIEIDVPAGLPLYPGMLLLEPWFCQRLGKRIDHVHNAVYARLEPRGVFQAERMIQANRGVVMVDSTWERVPALAEDRSAQQPAVT